MRVGLCGYAMSGKDVAASALVEQRGFVRVNMSDALFRDLRILDPLIETDGAPARLSTILSLYTPDEAKALYPDLRRMLQCYGTDVWRSVDADVWVNRAAREASKHEHVVTTGIRFLNELRYIDLLIHVERPSVGPVNDHVSDTGIAHVAEYASHHVLNDGTAEQLKERVVSLVDRYL
jgi:hypothetical protein